MKIRSQQLEQHLSRQLANLYLIFGEEPLLIIESAASILAAARAKNPDAEHTIIHIEKPSDWDNFEQECSNFSLFATEKIIDLRIHQEKFNDKANKVLLQYAENPNPDICVIIRAAKLDASQQKTRWFRAIDTGGVVVQVWALRGEDLNKWLSQKARNLQLNFTPEALNYFQQQTEGHLLAAKQEMERLAITHTNCKIELTTLRSALLDHARFDVFDLIEPILDRDAIQALRRLERLKDEGQEVAIILWAIAREVRSMGKMAHEVQRGQPVELVLQQNYVWAQHRQRIARWLKDKQPELWLQLTCLCQEVDQAIKGMHTPVDAWQALYNLITTFASRGQINLATGIKLQ